MELSLLLLEIDIDDTFLITISQSFIWFNLAFLMMLLTSILFENK